MSRNGSAPCCRGSSHGSCWHATRASLLTSVASRGATATSGTPPKPSPRRRSSSCSGGGTRLSSAAIWPGVSASPCGTRARDRQRPSRRGARVRARPRQAPCSCRAGVGIAAARAAVLLLQAAAACGRHRRHHLPRHQARPARHRPHRAEVVAQQQPQAGLVEGGDAQAAHGAHIGPHMQRGQRPEGRPDERLQAVRRPDEGHPQNHAHQRHRRLLQARGWHAVGMLWPLGAQH